MNLYLVPPKKYLWIPKRRKALFYIEKTFSRIEIGNTQQYLEHLLALGQGEKPKYRFAGYRTRSDQNGCREIFFDLDANLTFLKQIMAAIMQVPQEVEKRKQKTEDERRKQQEKYSSGQSLFQKETTQLAEELRELLGEKQDG